MYNQFGKKTSLIEKKRREGRRIENNDPSVVTDEDFADSFVLFFLLLSNPANLAYLSFNFISIIA